MGSVCCCWRDEWEDFANPNSSAYRNCICLHFFVQNVLHVYASVFHRGGHALPSSSSQGTSSLNSTEALDDSLADMYRAPPRPLPYDADPRYVRIQQDESVSRKEKGSTHSNSEMVPLRMSGFEKETDSLCYTSKQKDFACDGSKEYHLKSPLKLSMAKTKTGFAHIYPFSEDEDVCPTCLEDYTTENPKIVTKCSHHFHLGCIYEWMERSDTCPVCCKVMAFDETT